MQPGSKDGTLKYFVWKNYTTQTYYLYTGLTEGMILSILIWNLKDKHLMLFALIYSCNNPLQH